MRTVVRPTGSASALVFPRTVRTVVKGAFRAAAPRLVVLNEGLQQIGQLCFACCQLGEVRVSASVREIGRRAFFQCKLDRITFPEGSRLEVVGECAFQKADLQTIEVPRGVREIRNMAFSGSYLSSIRFQDNSQLETLGDGCFS